VKAADQHSMILVACEHMKPTFRRQHRLLIRILYTF
jgi:hypothetical protein